MAATTSRMGSFYNEKLAASQLRKYRKEGPIASTRTLIDALKAEAIEGATLLDIGGGIGAIQHELLDAGVARATSVDASAAYLDAAREESDRRGHGGHVTYLLGDFVELAESVPAADIVTLDRVLNVYPDWERLVDRSAARAKRLYGLVYPRDTPMVRLVVFAMNLVLRLRRLPVRASIRPSDAIERIVRENGLSPHFSQSVGPAWKVAVYRRTDSFQIRPRRAQVRRDPSARLYRWNSTRFTCVMDNFRSPSSVDPFSQAHSGTATSITCVTAGP